MIKEMTVSVEETVYNALIPLVKQNTLGDFLADCVRIHQQALDLDKAYKAMAADTEREAEAQEWCNASFGKKHDPR